ncbi:MAG: cyclic nucleotide-binding domain-containing protein [Myxococcota bacterium]
MSDTEAALWNPPASTRSAEPEGLAALRAVPLFHELKDGELKKILRLLHERTYQPGEVVFREGEPGAGMYIIKRGVVDIVIKLADGTEKVIASLTDKQFFGEMALLESAPRSATCVVRQRTELLGIFQPDLQTLIERDSRLGSKVLWNLATLMAGRVRAMTESMRAQRTGGAEKK